MTLTIKLNAARCDVKSDGETFAFDWKGKGSTVVAETMKLKLRRDKEEEARHVAE